MSSLTQKQQFFLDLVINYYKINNLFPTINELKKISNYKSYNTIYKYINILEKKDLIKYDHNRKQVIYVNKVIKDNNSLYIPFKDQDSYLNIIENNDYHVLTVHDNNLKNFGIFKNDLLIISNDLSYLNNKFVVIKNDIDYKIYKHIKKESYHYLINDKEELVFENTNIIKYKVISIIRNI